MPTPPFLVRLMDHRALSRSMRLGPEDSEAYAFAQELRVATLEGRLKAVWTHPANELAAATVEGGKVRVPARVALARALGLITGSSDYLFLWDGGSAAIEFKSDQGSLTPSQRDFRDWCTAKRVHFFVVRSVKQGLDLLESLGVLDRRPA